MELGVVSIAGTMTNSGVKLRLIEGNKERLKEGRKSNSSQWSSQAFYSEWQGRSRHNPRRQRGARGGRHAKVEEAALLLLMWAPPVSHIPKWYVAWAGCWAVPVGFGLGKLFLFFLFLSFLFRFLCYFLFRIAK
jgi:hypothetical protein